MNNWDDIDEDSAMSWDEWRDCDCFVKKGQKSRIRDILGKPQFTKDQVRYTGDDEDVAELLKS